MEKYLLSEEERSFLGYITNPDGKNCAKNAGNTTIIYYIDCEMVETVCGTEIISIGIGNNNDSDNNIIIKVKPIHKVTNYLTEITGYDESFKYDMTYDEVIIFLQNKINKSDILVGHCLYVDLNHLNFYHDKIIDTIMIYHHPDGFPYKYSLKSLAKKYLHKNIQNNIHNPLEDGKTAFELVVHSLKNKYVKTNWSHIGEKFVPTIDIVINAISITLENVYCIYTRGSRAIETNNEDSDYDIVVICDIKCNIINGTLTKYGNIDICIYDNKCFEQYVKEQIIWALECIYCNSKYVYLEKINFRNIAETYRNFHENACNDSLKKSVGYESSRKIASAKKHFINNNLHQAKKHIFIAIRFVDYGLQIIKYKKIIDTKRVNIFWKMLNEIVVNNFDEFESHWKNKYCSIYTEFCNSIPKFQKINKYSSYKKILTYSPNNHLLDTVSIASDNNHTLTNNDLTVVTLIDNLINFLTKNNLHALQEIYGIITYNLHDYQNLISLYSTNKMSGDFKYVCNGLILDTFDNYKIIAYPMNKFNNYYLQKNLTNIKHIFEKIDGHQICLYYYNNKWNIISNTNDKLNIIFSELFWKIFENNKCDVQKLNIKYTYVFEIVLINYPVIITYEKNNIFLICVRNLETFDEIDIYDDEFAMFDKPNIYDNFNCDNLNPMLNEGYVILMNDNSRVAIKTIEYIKKYFALTTYVNTTQNNINYIILKIILEGKEEELSHYFPEYDNIIQKTKDICNTFTNMIIKMYENIKMSSEECFERKIFALNIQKYHKCLHKYLYILFENKNINIFLSTLNAKRVYNDMCLLLYNHTAQNVHINKLQNKKYLNNVNYEEDINYEMWEKFQKEKSLEIIKSDTFDICDIKLIGGLDISFDKFDNSRGCAYITIFDIIKKKIVYEHHIICKLTMPYVSGFLGFRENKTYVQLLNEIKKNKPDMYPHVLMIDGFGILHHRGFGSASHLGYDTGLPTIGIAKTLLCVDNMNEHQIKEDFKKTCLKKNDYIDLVGSSGTKYGVAYKSSDNSLNPIFISIGNKISIETAIKITSNTCDKYRIPEPIRNSDIKSKIHLL